MLVYQLAIKYKIVSENDVATHSAYKRNLCFGFSEEDPCEGYENPPRRSRTPSLRKDSSTSF
jgi:hypothetical protein